MPEKLSIALPDSEALIDRIAQSLASDGLIVLPDCLPSALSEALRERAASVAGAAKRAGVGRGQGHTRDDALRTDGILWLDPGHPVDAAYLAWMERLRLGLNRRLFLGLFDYEAHFAVYEPGAYYRKHLDAFQGGTNRILTTVFYLNPGWTPDCGGELLVYAPQEDGILASVTPDFGKMVIFLSDTFAHEVAVTRRRRHSIAGWFRVNNGVGDLAV